MVVDTTRQDKTPTAAPTPPAEGTTAESTPEDCGCAAVAFPFAVACACPFAFPFVFTVAAAFVLSLAYKKTEIEPNYYRLFLLIIQEAFLARKLRA